MREMRRKMKTYNIDNSRVAIKDDWSVLIQPFDPNIALALVAIYHVYETLITTPVTI